jgi:ribosomal protein L16/L10AE
MPGMPHLELLTKNRQRGREEVASNLVQFETIRPKKSQREATKEMGIPRTTVQYWLKRRDELNASPVVKAFFESPEGLAFLHRLVMAARLVILSFANGSVRTVCLFLELSGLDVFVARSFGAQQKASVAMEEGMVVFGQEERARLAPIMEPKKVTVCEDETFHPEICLVAVEPISNFIILEKYTAQRDTKTWKEAVQGAVSDLPVSVIQVVSDEAKALIRHAEIELGVHHSPDLFHGQHEIGKGIFLPLSSQINRAEEEHDKAVQEAERLVKERHVWENQPQLRTGKMPDFAKLIHVADWRDATTEVDLENAIARKERAKEILGEIGSAYHPFDLRTGAPRQAEDVAQLLGKSFSDLDTIAQEAHLSERAIQHIEKARRLVPSMVETIAFFWSMVSISLNELALPQDIELAMVQNLIPAFYLRYAAGKAKKAVDRKAILEVSEQLLLPLRGPGSPLSALEKEQIRHLEVIAKECAGFFQRSSSCVEGRNGQLALRHHSQHNISPRQLQATTVTHNYYIKRSDGTTAAERFFGNKPKDLFEYLLARLDLPARPAKRRPKRTQKKWLLAA